MKRHFSPRWGVLGCLALLAACGAGASSELPQARGQALRVADSDPADVARMKKAVAPLVDRSPANLRVVNEPNGAVRREFVSGFREVMIQHTGLDGKPVVSCVDSLDGVDQAMTSARPAEVR